MLRRKHKLRVLRWVENYSAADGKVVLPKRVFFQCDHCHSGIVIERETLEKMLTTNDLWLHNPQIAEWSSCSAS